MSLLLRRPLLWLLRRGRELLSLVLGMLASLLKGKLRRVLLKMRLLMLVLRLRVSRLMW